MKMQTTLAMALLLFTFRAHAEVTLGLVAPFTGQQATFGEQMKRGADQAVADINAQGGINGESLVANWVDDACDPRQAVAAANKLMSSGVKFVVGHYCSGSAIPASKVYMDEGALLVSPAATNPKLTDEGKDTIFRVCGRDDRQGGIIGTYLALHFRDKKIAIAQDGSAYGRGLADEVKKTLNAAGVKEVMYETYTPGERDYSALISKLKQGGVQVVFLGGYHTEAGLIARQLKEQNFPIQLVGGDALVTDELWSIAGNAADGMLMTFGPDPRTKPEAKGPLAALRKSGFEPEGYTLYSYAAVQTIAEGIRRGGKTDPLKVAAALRQSPVSTVIGPVGFDAKGDMTGISYVMYRWHDGKYAEVQE
jgi:branched-chain amino acid transport system substrate-binding protein